MTYAHTLESDVEFGDDESPSPRRESVQVAVPFAPPATLDEAYGRVRRMAEDVADIRRQLSVPTFRALRGDVWAIAAEKALGIREHEQIALMDWIRREKQRHAARTGEARHRERVEAAEVAARAEQRRLDEARRHRHLHATAAGSDWGVMLRGARVLVRALDGTIDREGAERFLREVIARVPEAYLQTWEEQDGNDDKTLRALRDRYGDGARDHDGCR